jgi:TusA-related sulfurtransferase
VWQAVEQRAYCSASDGRIERMRLVCSGFWPVEMPDAMLDAAGEGCATLTPLIRSRLGELESGQVLEVRTDDPTAHESLQSWCTLTGNSLTTVGTSGTQGERFLIRKK